MEIKEKVNVSDDISFDQQYLVSRLNFMKNELSEREKEPSKKNEGISSEESCFDMNVFDDKLKSNMHLFFNKSRETTLNSRSIVQKGQDVAKSKKNGFGFKKKDFENDYKNLVKKHKINNIVNNFTKKLKMNLVNREPVEYQPFEGQQKIDFEKEGIQFNPIIKYIFFVLSILHTFGSCILATLSFAFQDVVNLQGILIFQCVSIFFILFEIFVGFFMVVYTGTVRLNKLKQISSHYLRRMFVIDLLCFLALLIDIFLEHQTTIFLRVIFFIKIPDSLEKLNKIQIKLFDTTYKQNWWDLAKIFLTNFMFAHIIAILLIMMTWMDEETSWLSTLKASTSPWYEQYAWSYYGGTTIMLTVGFGDISAANYKQAICLTFIQTFSCITLAYNIQGVGILLSNLRNEEVEKKKKLKLLRNLSDKNNITQDLSLKINNYIKETSVIKKKFDAEENKKFVSHLPQSLKSEFLRESHKNVFTFIPYFRMLTEHTLLKLAENIQLIITHPEEIIIKGGQSKNIYVLKQGEVGFCSKLKDSKFSNAIIDRIKVCEKDHPSILSLEFFNPTEKYNYEIKSKAYSILYTISMDQFMKILKEKDYDFQTFYEIKDRSKHIINEFQIVYCKFCKEKHCKFKCPKLHFIPIQQYVIFRHLKKQKTLKNERKYIKRCKKEVSQYANSALKMKLMYQQIANQMAVTNFSRSFTEDNNRLIFPTFQVDTANNQSRRNSSLIKDYMKNIMVIQQERNFWNIQSDDIKNYKFYFPFDNVQNLKNKTARKKHQKKGFFLSRQNKN